MEKFNIIDYNYSNLGEKHLIFFEVDKKPSEKLSESLVSKDKPFVIEIYAEKKKRSLTANSYLWLLLNKLAIKLKTTDEELYIQFLKDYGAKDYIAAPLEAKEMLERMYKIVEVVRDCTINNTKAVTFRLIRGSSKYDTKEFSVLLDAVVQECKEQGIETLEDIKLKELIERWQPE